LCCAAPTPDPTSASRQVLRTILYLLLLAAIIAVLWSIASYPARLPPYLNSLSRLLRSCFQSWRHLRINAKLKVVITFYQTLFVLGTTYSVKLPPIFDAWLSAFRFLKMDWLGIFVPDECIVRTYAGKLLLISLGPIIFMIGIGLVIVVRCAWEHRIALSDGSIGRSDVLKEGGLLALPFALVTTFVCIPSVSSAIFAAWSCETFGFVDQIATLGTSGGQVASTRAYLRQDLNVVCNDATSTSEAHQSLLLLAHVLIVVWPVGVLLLYASLLYSVRGRILKRSPNKLVRATAFLHRDFHPEYCFFEVLELVRRTLLIGWVALIPESIAYIRLVVGVLVSLLALLAILLRQPYKAVEDHLVAVSAHCVLLVVFIGAGYIKAFEDTDAMLRSDGKLAEGESFAAKIYGFKSSDSVAAFLLIFTFGLLLMLLATLFLSIYKQGIVQTLRDERTGQLPVLTLRKGERYHLFLSHIWSTGQVCI
jgi:hypothetical protein